MTREELIKVVADKSQLRYDQASAIIDAFIEQIKIQLAKGEKVNISGFGSFVLSERKAKTFVNPKTGKTQELPDRVLPHFKAGENLKKLIK